MLKKYATTTLASTLIISAAFLTPQGIQADRLTQPLRLEAKIGNNDFSQPNPCTWARSI